MQLGADHVISAEISAREIGLLAACEAVRGGPRLCCTRLCVSATSCCCVPGHRHRKWHGRLLRRQDIRRLTVRLLCDGVLTYLLVRYAAADGRDPGHGSATRKESHTASSKLLRNSPAFMGNWDYCHEITKTAFSAIYNFAKLLSMKGMSVGVSRTCRRLTYAPHYSCTSTMKAG